MRSRVIGVDFSTTSTGIAIYDGEWRTATVKSKSAKAEPDADFYKRMQELIGDALLSIWLRTSDLVAMEAQFMGRGGDRDRRLAYAWHRFREEVGNYGGQVQFQIAPASLKKLATGNGRCEKADMTQAVRDRIGLDLGNRHDEADAVWIAVAAAEAMGEPIPNIRPLDAAKTKEKK